MKKLFFAAASLILLCIGISSCNDHETYADLVDNERNYINKFIGNDPFNNNFGHIITKDEDWVNTITKDVVTDSIHPEKAGIELEQWYRIDEGDFKRLYFCIHNWGEDGLNAKRASGSQITDQEYKDAMRNGKKFYTGKNALVRFDNLYLLNDFDYDNLSNNTKIDNLDPLSFKIIYNWTPYYYSNQYYGYNYSSSTSYECGSGGLGFAPRFLWEGGEVSLIVPFSLVESDYSQYYYTLYYGQVRYSRPNYLPQ